MPASYLHGVETIEIDQGPRPVQLVKTAVIGLIGSAATGPVNKPVLVTNERDFAPFGQNIPGSTILDALNIIYQQKGTVCIVLNVLDPTRHKTEIITENNLALDGEGGFRLSRKETLEIVVKDSTGNTTYLEGRDYQIDPHTGIGKRLAGGAIPSPSGRTSVTLTVSYRAIDPTRVNASDILGDITASGQRTGLKAFRDSYSLFGYFPKILIAPGFSTLTSVSTELIATATSIRAVTLIDAPVAITSQQAIAGRGPAGGSVNLNFSSDRVGICYPYVKAYDQVIGDDVVRPLSTYVAGALSRKDQENGYWWSLSNTELLGVTGIERPIDARINDPNCEANLLNAAGLITVFRSYGTGIRTWGNRSAAFPSNTSPKNFLCVRRVADIIAESLEYFTLQYIDRPLDRALIDDIVESCNRFIRKLKADGAIIDGRAWFDPNQNPATELAAGHLTVLYDFMPPTPAERVSYQAKIEIDYLKQLGKTN